MFRPPLEVADLIRAAGMAFFEHSRKWFTWLHLKILTAIVCCRTSALGGHIDECSGCGHRAISFNSCRNRHCPKCQSNARDRWLEARRRELLPTRYVHVVFTLPRELAPLCVTEQTRGLQPLIPGQRRDVAGRRARPAASRRRDRLLQRAAYLESETAASSVCPLRGSGRRIGSRSHPVDRGGDRLLLTRESPEPRFPRQVRRRPAGTARQRQPRISRRTGGPGVATRIRRHAALPVPLRLGGLLQAPFRRCRTRAPLFGRLHASRGHLESSPGGARPG